jgi:aminocarboxymuconate-semialdehyde decarboxylase
VTIKSGPAQGMSRRQLLQAGLATAATVAIGHTGEATPQDQTPPTDVRVIDIHAHYFPEAYLDLVASDGKRFDAA